MPASKTPLVTALAEAEKWRTAVNTTRNVWWSADRHHQSSAAASSVMHVRVYYFVYRMETPELTLTTRLHQQVCVRQWSAADTGNGNRYGRVMRMRFCRTLKLKNSTCIDQTTQSWSNAHAIYPARSVNTDSLVYSSSIVLYIWNTFHRSKLTNNVVFAACSNTTRYSLVSYLFCKLTTIIILFTFLLNFSS